jgi:hypothetical protein
VPIAAKSMLMRKSLFLILTLALIMVPVFLMAHAFTHFAQADVQDAADSGEEAIDLDEICLDCLALTGFNFLFIAAALLFGNSVARRCLPLWPPAHLIDSNRSPYRSRAPPSPAV